MADNYAHHKHAAVRVLGEAFLLENHQVRNIVPTATVIVLRAQLTPRVSRGQAIAKLLSNDPTLARITFFVCVIGGPQFARQLSGACPPSLIIPTDLPQPRLGSCLYSR
jgi:hypothetical protein